MTGAPEPVSTPIRVIFLSSMKVSAYVPLSTRIVSPPLDHATASLILENSAPEGATIWTAAETGRQRAVHAANARSRRKQETRHTGSLKYGRSIFRGFHDCAGIGEFMLVLGDRNVMIREIQEG